MPLSIGIIGLPNVGKSTLFKALTKKEVHIENFPFCTIDPNIGIVDVPDPRLDKLIKATKSKKTIPTSIKFVDIAGLVKGAHRGEGLGNQFLSHIREVDAICEVVRAFSDKNVTHIENSVDVKRDIETVDIELIMKDLETVQKRIDKIAGKARSGNIEYQKELELLKKIKDSLNNTIAIRELALTKEELKKLKQFNLLTIKPIIYVINVDENLAGIDREKIKQQYGLLDTKYVLPLSVKIESEIVELEKGEQNVYLKDLGLEKSGFDALIMEAYKLLQLITFFSYNKNETRAWTTRKGTKAPQAAGVIHSDFEKGFIRVEIIEWNKLVEAGSESSAREMGLIRTEGKDYTIMDGDVCHFLFH